MTRSPRFRPPGDCPNCGASVPRGARVCRACGASHADGWSAERDTSAFEHPSGDFDYDDFAAREFGGWRSKRGLNPRVVAIVIGVLLVAWILATVLHR